MSTTTFRTPEQVADLFQVPRDFVLASVRDRGWPHLRLSARTIRFTEDDVRAIGETFHRDLADQRPEPNPWGRVTRGRKGAS